MASSFLCVNYAPLHFARISPTTCSLGDKAFHPNFIRIPNLPDLPHRIVRSQKYSNEERFKLFSQPKDFDEDDDKSDENENMPLNSDEAATFRARMERIFENDDQAFTGKDLALLIREKYGKSYDVQLIKKEFMGRQYLAMNVMWKYREQKSFPLTEQQYIDHLDGIADNIRCWGAVSVIRNSLQKTKERPRIGKAVSIFIDIDETGGRANEWINQ